MTNQKNLHALILACAFCMTQFIFFQAKPLDAQNNQGQFRPPQDIDGSRLAPGELPPPSASVASSARVFDQLFREIDNLIPGEFSDGSVQKKLVEDAIRAFQIGDANRVIELFKELAIDPNVPPPDVLLAGLSYSSQDANTGRLLMERASRDNPNNVAVFAAFARLALNQQRTTDALVHLEKMDSLSKTSKLSEDASRHYKIQYLDGMTEVALAQQRFGDARNLLIQQRELRPNHPRVLLVSAELEFKENKLDKCIEFLTTLKEKFPSTRPHEAIIASWFQRVGNREMAEKWVRDAAAKHPSDTQVQLEFASWSLNIEDFPTASESIKKAELADKETPFSKSLKARIAFARQSYLIAEAHYEALMTMEPGNFDFSNMYALCLVESADPAKRKKAREIAMQNFRNLPNSPVAVAALGYIQLRLGEMEQAQAILPRVAKVGNTSAEIDYFVASYLLAKNDTVQAKQFLERALQSKDLFLYRSAAKKMLATINSLEPKSSPETQPDK